LPARDFPAVLVTSERFDLFRHIFSSERSLI
jgi:hypothetical protein